MWNNILKQGRTKPLQERIGGGGGGGGKRWWELCGIQRDGKERIGTKVKTWGEGWGLFLILFRTVEPQYNETRYNEVLGITNDIFCPSYSIMYGKEPRYNQTSF